MKYNSESRRSQEAINFISEIDKVCSRLGFVLSHEDPHGAFIVVRGNNNDWFLDALELTDDED